MKDKHKNWDNAIKDSEFRHTVSKLAWRENI